MIRITVVAPLLLLVLITTPRSGASRAEGILIDHEDTDLTALSQVLLERAKTDLHVAYGHTSHGSQLTTGMSGLVGFINGGGLGLSYPPDFFAWNNGGSGGALDLHDYFKPGDLGNPDRTTWAARTRDYLGDPANSDVNVIIWSWCGQADTSEANINLYLGLMSQLEIDYPNVSFVYMTGHVNGCSTTGNLFLRNQQIRDYCTANDKILYDFADIESWDPDGNYYGDKLVTDNCDYDSDGNGSRDRNWAIDWQNSHVEGVDWYTCSAAHSQPLNGNRKAYAAWSLWAEIAAVPKALTWDNGAGDNDWCNKTNWGPDYSPLPFDQLTVNAGTPATTETVSVDSGGSITVVGLATSVSLGNLSVGNTGTGTVSLQDGASLAADALLLGPGAGLEIELRADGHGQLNVAGSASLAGDLEILLTAESPFTAGIYPLVTYDSHTDAFASVTALGAYVTGDGLDYGDYALTLTIEHDLLPGDLDLDGDVDFTDYVRAKVNFGRTEGATWGLGDMDRDGDVDYSDYSIVKGHFGRSLSKSESAEAAGVPEPGSLVMLAAGLIGLGLLARRRRRG